MATKARNAPSVSWWDVTLQLLQIVAAGAALFGWITIVGGARVFARFHAAHLPSPVRTVTLVPRDALFAEGLRALWKPLLLGLVVAALLYVVLRAREHQREQLMQALDARYAERYEAHGWTNPERSLHLLPDADAQFARYVRLRRKEELGAVLPEAKDALDELERDTRPDDEDVLHERDTRPDDPAIQSSTSRHRGGAAPLSPFRHAGRAARRTSGIVRTSWPVLVAVAAIGIVVAGLLWWLLDIRVVAAIVMPVALLTALALALLAFSVTTGPGTRSFVVFAAVVVLWSLAMLLDEWGNRNPHLDYAFVSLKDREGLLRAVYVARQDGDVYLSREKDDEVWLTMIPAEEIKQLVVAVNQKRPPRLPPEEKPDRVERDEGPTIFVSSLVENVIEDIQATPTPAPEPDMTGPEILALDRASARLNSTGAFALRLVRFDERVSGHARFVTRPLQLKDGRHRVALGVRPFQTEAKRAPVLRVPLSPRAKKIVRRHGSVPVTVRITVWDRNGNASRMSACITVVARPRAASRAAGC